jgi:iron-sulfur cluster repair protein YtfE (RIC family)
VGGFLERMVGCVKQCLRKTFGRARLKRDALETVLVEVERNVSYKHLPTYPASKVLSYFFSARHGEARETLQNLCILFVEPTIQKLG